jgi:hypothetical protein
MEHTTIEGYTASQLAKLSKKTRHAVEAWLSYNDIKPVINELLYPPETLDALLKANVGRPAKKPESPGTSQKPRKPKP